MSIPLSDTPRPVPGSDHKVRRKWPGVSLCLLCVGALAYACVRWHQARSPSHMLAQAAAAIRGGDLRTALRLAAELAKRPAYQEHARWLGGQALAQANLWEQAISELNQIPPESELAAQAAALVGECFMKLGRPTDAEPALHFAVDRLPDHADAHRWLATIYFDRGFMPGAITHLEIVARLDPVDGRPHRLLGLIYKDFQQNDPGIKAYLESLRRQPDAAGVAQIALELAELQEAERDYTAALETLSRYLPDRSGSAAALALEASCLLACGQPAGTIGLLDRALAVNSREARALRLRGKLYLEAHDPAAAVPLLERAIEINRHDYQSRYQLALAYGQLGDAALAEQQLRAMKESQAFLEKLTTLNQRAFEAPTDAKVRYELGNLCRQMGERDMAAMWFKAALACDPGHTGAQESLQDLQ